MGIVGPCEAGKTTLANFLADATETVIEDYNPTNVVRVLEFDSVSKHSTTLRSLLDEQFILSEQGSIFLEN